MSTPQPASTPDAFRAPIGRAPWWWVSIILILGLTWALFYSDAVQRSTGLKAAPIWADSDALLTINDAHQAGYNVYQPNPYGTLHLYSNLWLKLGGLGLTQADHLPFALSIVCIFLVPGMLLLRPATWRESLWMLAFFSSEPVLLGLYRANSDLVIFGILVGVVPCLLSQSRIVQSLAPVLIVFAAALKYYPLIGACVLLVEPKKERRRWLLIVFAAALVLAMTTVYRDLKYIPSAPQAAGLKVSYGAPIFLSLMGIPEKFAPMLGIGLGGLVVGLTWRWNRAREWTCAVSTDWRYIAFILSASVVAGCYWAGGSWSYRLIALYGIIPFAVAAPRPELMPTILARLISPLRWILGFLLVSQTLVSLTFWVLWQRVSYELLISLWDTVTCLLHFGYLPLAIACTIMVANLVCTRVKEGL